MLWVCIHQQRHCTSIWEQECTPVQWNNQVITSLTHFMGSPIQARCADIAHSYISNNILFLKRDSLCAAGATQPPKKQLPARRSVTPCLPPGMKWLIPPQSSVPLLCGKGEAVTPISGHLLPRSLVLFTVWIRHSWIGLDYRQNISMKFHPKPLFLIQFCLSNWLL